MGSKVMLRYNAWDVPKGLEENNLYEPDWNDPDEELIKKSGHGGSDFLTAKMFIECIKEGKQPQHPCGSIRSSGGTARTGPDSDRYRHQ
jgi:hypothetical protein